MVSILQCALAAVMAALACSVAGRSLRREPPPSPSPCPPGSWDCGGPTPNSDREQCGRLGQPCCELEIEGNTFISTCVEDTLFCLGFPSSPDDFNTQQPSLCLPRPAGCGAADGVCCPLTGNKTSSASTRCLADDTICLAPTSSTSIFGDATYDLYLQLKADPQTPVPPGVGLTVWGTCQAFQADSCGQPGGLCGPPLNWPAPFCVETARNCPDGYFCEEQEGQWEAFGLCAETPAGCGELGSGCCPNGNYTQGTFSTPFCWLPDVYCAAQASNISDSECRQLPKSPEECGTDGQPCCPTAYGIITDKTLPPLCQDGSYCSPTDEAEGVAPTCTPNPPGCGRIGKPCCAMNGRAGLVYTCNSGVYCPELSTDGGGGSGGGMLLLSVAGDGDRVCQECTLDVAQQYQAICGIGVGIAPNDDYDYYDYAPAPAPGPMGFSADGGDADLSAPAPRPAWDDLPPVGPPSRQPAAPAPGPLTLSATPAPSQQPASAQEASGKRQPPLAVPSREQAPALAPEVAGSPAAAPTASQQPTGAPAAATAPAPAPADQGDASGLASTLPAAAPAPGGNPGFAVAEGGDGRGAGIMAPPPPLLADDLRAADTASADFLPSLDPETEVGMQQPQQELVSPAAAPAPGPQALAAAPAPGPSDRQWEQEAQRAAADTPGPDRPQRR